MQIFTFLSETFLTSSFSSESPSMIRGKTLGKIGDERLVAGGEEDKDVPE